MAKNKNYPITLDPIVYEALKAIAAAQGKTIKEVVRSGIGLYIADNIRYLSIERKTSSESQEN